ncbi:MAG: hypothetical protein LBK95_09515 [Bifidobacteriaceae bacterium]|nr:hypothetical protein [Bifidobacteriaceae bacterium]
MTRGNAMEKRWNAALTACAMAFVICASLAGCGKTEPAGQSTGQAAVEQPDSAAPESGSSGVAEKDSSEIADNSTAESLDNGLLSLADERPTTDNSKWREILDVMPDSAEVGIGHVDGTYVSSVDGGSDDAGRVQFILTVNREEQYLTLRDYYKGLGGTTVAETDDDLQIEYDWGIMSQCSYRKDDGEIVVNFDISL